VAPLVSQAFGAGRPREAGAAAEKGAVLVAALCVATFLAHVFSRPLLEVLHQDAELIPGAVQYLQITAAGIPAFGAFLLVRQILEGNGIMRPAMWAVVIANLVNFFLDLGLGLGWFGLPKLGIAGVAWATVAVRWTMLVALVIVAWKPLVAARPTSVERARMPLRRVADIALPVGLHSAVEAWAFVVAALVAGTLGAVEAAAHAAAMNMASLSFMVPLGVGAAASSRVGNLVGAKQPWARVAWVSVAMGIAVMTLSATVFWTIPGVIGRWFTTDVDVIAAIALVLPVAAAFQLFDGTQAVAFGVLRGVGDTRVPSIIALFAFWGLGIPVELYLAYGLGWGLQGVWLGLVVGLSVVAVLLVGRIVVFTRIDVPPSAAPL
jgi:multidrug resistance protein, MATE family